MLTNVIEGMVPEAKAGEGANDDEGWYVCAMVMGDMVDVTLAGLSWWCETDKAAIIRQGMVPMDGNTGIINAISWSPGDCGPWDTEPSANQKVATVAINPDKSSASELVVVVHPKNAGPFELNVPLSPSGCLPLPPLYDCDNDCGR